MRAGQPVLPVIQLNALKCSITTQKELCTTAISATLKTCFMRDYYFKSDLGLPTKSEWFRKSVP